MQVLQVLFLLLVALVISSCSQDETGESGHNEGHTVHWGYDDHDGPDAWGSMSTEWAVCDEGQAQSPINLTGATAIEMPAVVMELPSAEEVEMLNQEGVVNQLDNGHTIQVNAKSSEKLSIGDKSYTLVQFHFHAPSEHTVNGVHFPMEMHFVHQADNGALAVVGAMIEEGAENPGLAPFWAELQDGHGAQNAVDVPEGFAGHIFSDVGSGFYHYDGSLTTPPCSEGVSWYVRKTPTELSAEQIAAFTAMYDHNNRPVQPLNERMLYVDDSPSVVVR